jgi:excisionase family DNA binding protein
MEPLLTADEAARILRIHPKVLERKAKAGTIPGIKVGKFWRFRTTDLESWIGSQVESQRQPCRKVTSF